MLKLLCVILWFGYAVAEESGYEWVDDSSQKTQENKNEEIIDDAPPREEFPDTPEEEAPRPDDSDLLETTETNKPVTYTPNKSSRPFFYWGVEGGYSFLSPNLSAEQDLKGFQVALDMGIHYDLSHLVVAATFGWFFNKMKSVSGENPETSIRTNAFKLELDVRYYMNNFYIAPVGEMLFGTDVGFANQVLLVNPEESRAAGFMGLKLGMKVPGTDGGEVALKALYDVSLSDRNVGSISLEAEYPIPFLRPKEAPKRGVASVVEFAPKVKRIRRDRVQVILEDEKGVYFDTDSYKVYDETKKYLLLLGRVLKKHPKSWKKLIIDGHADIRGTVPYNVDLSRKRAKIVLLYLKYAGADPKKMRIRGFGPHKPVDEGNNPTAWGRNRRVVMNFHGLSNAKAFMKIIEKIRLIALRR